MKLLLEKPVQKDHQAVMTNPTKLLIHNGLERTINGKNYKYVTKEMSYRQLGETVVGLKMHIHQKRVLVSRKHYLLQVRGTGESLMIVSGCFTPLKNFFNFLSLKKVSKHPFGKSSWFLSYSLNLNYFFLPQHLQFLVG